MTGRVPRRSLTRAERRLAEAARLEAIAFERLGRCGDCLDRARTFITWGESGPSVCPTCGGTWREPSVLALLQTVMQHRGRDRTTARLPGF